MNAFVINENQIKTAGFVLLGVIVASFLSGYFLGMSMSTPVGNNAQQIKKDIVPKVSEAVAIESVVSNVVESKSKDSEKTDKKNKSQNKKIDKKETKKKKEDKKISAKNKTPKKSEAKKTTETKKPKKAEKKKTVINKVASNKKSQNKKSQNKKNQNEKKDKKQNAVSEKEKNKESKKTTDKKSTTSANDKAKKTANPTSDNTQTNERMYSIQAGMFTSEANANSFIEKLAAKEFSAYISSFMSSSGATKYNVRVGKFKQRDQAREILKGFQKAFSSPAYVVIAK